MKIYQVGGCVRDRLLGLDPKDIDYVVVGGTEQDMLALGYSKVGADFPVFLHPTTYDQYALARKERKTGIGYNGFTVDADSSVTLEEDLSRRDLTINAMALDTDTGAIIDPFNGAADLKLGVLRHVSSAFAEDPIRVLRTARFAARYGFAVDPSTLALMREVSPELDHVPQERVWAEIEKGLMEQQPVKMFEILHQCGALTQKSMCAYTGVDADMMKAITNETPLAVRFAATASTFTDADYETCCIPNQCARVAKAFNRHVDALMFLELRRTEARVKLLMELRAFNSLDLFNDVLSTWELARGKGLDTKYARLKLMTDLDAAKTVNALEVAASCNRNGIQQAIFEARCKAIRGD